MIRRYIKVTMLAMFATLPGPLCHVAKAQSPPPSSGARPAVKSCKTGAEYRQFDFWVGEWDVQVGGKPAGSSSVQLILGDCVIFENWTGVGGMIGKSFNIYDASRGRWQQTWVDSTGTLLELYGEFKDGAMRLIGEKSTPNGGPNAGKTLNKISFFPLDGGRVRQLWESSQDDGKSWQVLFDGLYTRRK